MGGIILSNSYYLSVDPLGSIIEAVDIFAKAIYESYAIVNCTAQSIDTFIYLIGGGEVHYGSNVWLSLQIGNNQLFPIGDR